MLRKQPQQGRGQWHRDRTTWPYKCSWYHTRAALNLPQPSRATPPWGTALGAPACPQTNIHIGNLKLGKTYSKADSGADVAVLPNTTLGPRCYPLPQPGHACVTETRSTAWGLQGWTARCREMCLSGENEL